MALLDSSTHSSPSEYESDSEYESESESENPNPSSGSIGGPVEIPIDITIEEKEKIVEMYKSALTHYQDSHPEKSYESVKPNLKGWQTQPLEKLESHPGKSYEFESVHEAIITPVAGFNYRLKFRAKNMMEDGNPIQVFKAVGYSRVGGVLKAKKCVLLE